MKFLVVLACLLVAAHGLAPEIKQMIMDKVMGHMVECKGDTGATDDDIAPLKAGQAPPNHTAKCFVACMHKKFGIQNQSGKIDKDGIYAMVEKMKIIDEDLAGKMKTVADICLGKVTDDADECETAANVMACIHAEHKAAGLEPMEM